MSIPFHLPISFGNLEPSIKHTDKIMLIGSCFTEHMSKFLAKAKFNLVQNSHGILFNPISVCDALHDLCGSKEYTSTDIFQYEEYWHSWRHHSDFSDLEQEVCLNKINVNISLHRAFLRELDYIIITLGSAFGYYHLNEKMVVGNNHRAPANWFEKKLLSAQEITIALEEMQRQVLKLNPKAKFIYTISPVRHSRDGLIENNRSKARLIEAVHALQNAYYFPAYEIVIDVLRDYRFYDVDLVHPNYQATQHVWEYFVSHCIDEKCLPLMRQLEQIYKAFHHRPKDVRSQAHQKFLAEHKAICKEIINSNTYLNLTDEIAYFNSKPIIL